MNSLDPLQAKVGVFFEVKEGKKVRQKFPFGGIAELALYSSKTVSTTTHISRKKFSTDFPHSNILSSLSLSDRTAREGG